MAIELKMPALSPTMEQGTLAKWLKQEGDTGGAARQQSNTVQEIEAVTNQEGVVRVVGNKHHRYSTVLCCQNILQNNSRLAYTKC